MPSCVNCNHSSCLKKKNGKCVPPIKTCGLTNKRVTTDFFRKNDCKKWEDMISWRRKNEPVTIET